MGCFSPPALHAGNTSSAIDNSNQSRSEESWALQKRLALLFILLTPQDFHLFNLLVFLLLFSPPLPLRCLHPPNPLRSPLSPHIHPHHPPRLPSSLSILLPTKVHHLLPQ